MNTNKKIQEKSKSPKKTIGLLVLLLSLFSSTCSSKFLSIKNDNINCLEHNCEIQIKKNQKLIKNNTDERIINIIEEINGKEEIIKYLFYTTDIKDVGAYSGKPLEILISLKKNGLTIDNLKLIKHSEPILLTGIPIEKLLEAISFYKGKSINKKINIGDDNTGDISIPIITGATVTSLILHETILDTSREVSRIIGKYISSSTKDFELTNNFKKLSWDELIKKRAIKNYKLDENLKENENSNKNSLLIDIYIADLRHPSIGKNILGEAEYEELFKNSESYESAIMILNKGEWSFKGSGFARGGIFDRFRIEQENNIFTFREQNLKYIYDLEEINIDDFRETGIFTIKDSKFKIQNKWNLKLLVNKNTYNIEYKIPREFCKKIESSISIKKIWQSKSEHIITFFILWTLTILIFIFKDKIAKNKFYLSYIYNSVLILDIYIIGILFEGQPSIVNVLDLINNIQYWKSLLFDPLIFLGWVMIILTVFLWGKAIFCGWICPFGALQEVLFKLKNIITRNENSFEFLNNKFRYLRYIILFILIFTTLAIGLKQAQILADLEPFKTMWILGLNNRPIFISLYTISILLISITTYRFFCRFICPLGAFLSLLSFKIAFKIKRRGTCNVCKICKNTCNSKAIDKFGNIDSKECFGCFTCINNMYNVTCPEVKNEKVRKKYAKDNW